MEEQVLEMEPGFRLRSMLLVRMHQCSPLLRQAQVLRLSSQTITAVDMAVSMIGDQLNSSAAANLECFLTPSQNMDVQEVEPWTLDGSPPVVTQANLGPGWAEVIPLFKRRRQ